MIRVRRAETDADREAWRQVRIAVVPPERTATVEEMRRTLAPEQLLLLAELDGEVVGAGIGGRSDLRGHGSVIPRVLPEARRRGVGTALLRELAAHVESLGFDRVGDEDRPDRAENSLTAVRRDSRRRGLALTLKQMTIAWAAENGIREVYTWTQRGNEGMRAVNEKLGYETRTISIRVRGDLPLPA
jgi:GNAT superfamily N-acetyltransferase